MKNTFLSFSLIITSLVLSPFTKQTTYNVDTEKSSITWIGKKLVGKHEGTIKINSGVLKSNQEMLQSGSFEVNMNTVTCTDLEGEWKDKLIGHLKSDDFFAVQKHPKANFEITKVTHSPNKKITVSGKLTIKGITREISFRPTIKYVGDEMIATVNDLMIDRTKYDIKYNSKNFFDDLGDKMIDDEFELNIKLVAKK